MISTKEKCKANFSTNWLTRWDICAIDPLPDYMKVFYKAMLEVYIEIEEELAKEGNLYRIHYAIEAVSPIYLVPFYTRSASNTRLNFLSK